MTNWSWISWGTVSYTHLDVYKRQLYNHLLMSEKLYPHLLELDRADHKTENLFHEQRRHWDGREFDEYIITTEGVGAVSYTHLDVYKRQT